MDAKKKAIQDKVNAPKNKAAGVKNQLDNKRKKLMKLRLRKLLRPLLILWHLVLDLLLKNYLIPR